MFIAHVILRWVIQPIVTLVIGRACLEVAHSFGWYPEQQLARLIVGVPNPLESEMALWGLTAIVGATLWALADYFLYRRPKSAPQRGNKKTGVASSRALDLWSEFEDKAKATAEGLAEYLLAADELLERPVDSEPTLNKWKEDYKAWYDGTRRFIRENISAAQEYYFTRIGMVIASTSRDNAFNAEHNGLLNILGAYRSNLEHLHALETPRPTKPRAALRPKNVAVAAPTGRVTFNYSTNNGVVAVGTDASSFKLSFSKADNTAIHMQTSRHTPRSNLKGLARVKGAVPGQVLRFHEYDSSSSSYTIRLGENFLAENPTGRFMQGKILAIKDDSRGDNHDEVTFDYQINGDGSAEFIAL